jgi:hypothetical protein
MVDLQQQRELGVRFFSPLFLVYREEGLGVRGDFFLPSPLYSGERGWG